MCQEEDTCREDAEEAEQGTYMKLSVTHVTKRDISVAIAPSIHGINQAIAARAIGPHPSQGREAIVDDRSVYDEEQPTIA